MSGPERLHGLPVGPAAVASEAMAADRGSDSSKHEQEQPMKPSVSEVAMPSDESSIIGEEMGSRKALDAQAEQESIDPTSKIKSPESSTALSGQEEVKNGMIPQETKGKRSRRRSSSNRKGGRSSSRSSSVAVDEEAELQSPYQMFRNTLIVEESFRQQYQGMAVSRRKHILFFCILVVTTGYYTYSVFINPSIYKMFNFFDRLMLMGTVITLGLFHLTGLYTKTFIYEPKFVYSINKGLRPFNMKLVKIRKNWAEYILGLFYNPAYQSRPGRLVKLVLSARTFNQETVENWEMYRQDYWDREWERYCRRDKKRLG